MTTRVEDLEDLEETELLTDDADVSPTILQDVVNAWEEPASGPRAESACTAAVQEWEESHR